MLFAPRDDKHADAVEAQLAQTSTAVSRIDLSNVNESLTIIPGRAVEVGDVHLEPGVRVWWRRAGAVQLLPSLTTHENRLRVEESQALLIGGLLSIAGLWVDDPFTVMRAEHKILQLAVASEVGVARPETLATNDPNRAEAFNVSTGPLIAKSTSAGIGIAPHADVIDPGLFPLLESCATLLQPLHRASADLRVVTVGAEVFAWSRTRRVDDPVDWRAADPQGHGFRPIASDLLSQVAISITNRMGLQFSVQDWLMVDGKYIFLEVNPSGQWLFLDGARDLVSHALAALLTRTI